MQCDIDSLILLLYNLQRRQELDQQELIRQSYEFLNSILSKIDNKYIDQDFISKLFQHFPFLLNNEASFNLILSRYKIDPNVFLDPNFLLVVVDKYPEILTLEFIKKIESATIYKNFILDAVLINSFVLEYVNDSIKSDIEVQLEVQLLALKNNFQILKFISNMVIVFIIVQK